MKSPFLLRMKKKDCDIVRKNINLGQFKDQLISYLIAIRALDGEIVDLEFGLPSKGCVPLEIYIKSTSVDAKKGVVEDQVDKKTRGKKRS